MTSAEQKKEDIRKTLDPIDFHYMNSKHQAIFKKFGSHLKYRFKSTQRLMNNFWVRTIPLGDFLSV